MFTTLFKNKSHKNVKNTSLPSSIISYFLNFPKCSIRYFFFNCEKGMKTNHFITTPLKLFICKQITTDSNKTA